MLWRAAPRAVQTKPRSSVVCTNFVCKNLRILLYLNSVARAPVKGITYTSLNVGIKKLCQQLNQEIKILSMAAKKANIKVSKVLKPGP